jgi:serine phosphatase RsbU (regulator of sigma subunit)
MKLLSFLTRPAVAARTPAPLVAPVLDSVRVDLQYHKARSGGDFFDALTISDSRLVFLMMDIAGQRTGAMDLAVHVQDEFRTRIPELFKGDINESDAISEHCLHLNRTILAVSGRARMSAAFIGVLNCDVGTLAYINAGHVPGLLLTANSKEFLESTGLPLGLFSHATHEACFRVLPRGGALLMASRGIVEARTDSGVIERIEECIGRSSEFGAEGILKATADVPLIARSLCRAVLDSAIANVGRHMDNDMSVAAISRDA